MPILLRSDKFFVCFESDNGAAGLLDIRKRGKITKEQYQRLIEIIREGLLQNFRETRVLNVETVCQQIGNEFENLSVEIDSNIRERGVENINEMFVDWFGENVDVAFVIDDRPDFPTISLSSEGSEEKIFETFQMYGIA